MKTSKLFITAMALTSLSLAADVNAQQSPATPQLPQAPNMTFSLTVRGLSIPGAGYAPNRHDAVTGSTVDGRAFPAGEDRTCRNWTSITQGAAMLGHIDRKGLRDDAPSRSWNSSHPSRGPE